MSYQLPVEPAYFGMGNLSIFQVENSIQFKLSCGLI